MKIRMLNYVDTLRLSENQYFFALSTHYQMNGFVLAVTSADPSLGKVDKHSFSQQTLMELLIETIQETDEICGDFEDITQWEGVSFNESGEVIAINWESIGELGGSVDIKWLPSSLEVFSICEKKVGGVLDMTSLPSKIRHLDMDGNCFTGSLHLRHLPETLEAINVASNFLSGSLNLEGLPPGLQMLDVNSNRFTGSVRLIRLPETMQSLILRKNELSGTIDLTQLPHGIQWMNLSDTLFEGQTDFSKLPVSLEIFYIQNTKLEGTIRMIHNSDVRQYFQADNSKVVIIRDTDESNMVYYSD